MTAAQEIAVTRTVLVLAFLDLGVLTGQSGINVKVQLMLGRKEKHVGCRDRKIPLRK